MLYTTHVPPLEIRHLPGLNDSYHIGYVTFVLFPRHSVNPLVATSTITHIQLFRDYLLYDITYSKTYTHSRVRYCVSELQKVLDRAKTEQAVVDRKTVSCVVLLVMDEVDAHYSVQRAVDDDTMNEGMDFGLRSGRFVLLNRNFKAVPFFSSRPSRCRRFLRVSA